MGLADMTARLRVVHGGRVSSKAEQRASQIMGFLLYQNNEGGNWGGQAMH